MKRLVQKVLLPAFLALPALLLLAQKPPADDTDIRTVDEI